MAKIKKYKNKKNEDRYEFQIYGGIDPNTGRKITTRRRGFKTKREAVMAYDRLDVEIEENGGVLQKTPSRATFQQIYELWLVQYQQTVKDTTWFDVSRQFELKILPTFGKRYIDSINVVACQEMINDWYKRGLSNYKLLMDYVSRVFRYAISLGLIQLDPAKMVVVPRNPNQKARNLLDNYYTPKELKEFLELCKQQYSKRPQKYVFFRLAAFSGMRKGEMLALQWSDVDFEHNCIRVNKTQARGVDDKLVTHSPKTAASNRMAYIDQKTMNILKHWQQIQRQFFLAQGINVSKDSNLVFSDINNHQLYPYRPQDWLASTIKKCHLKKVTVHGFRHTYATLAAEAGIEPKAVQAQLGHSSIATTLNIYTAVTKKERNTATDKLAEYLAF
ncbi:site-specific integrase [Lactobacillus sp. LC28-10]|uniref:Site-specific integrase n=1 Tax=Secundilactobacillus angelensis TaxID=2722706 RepID=A0ABX1L4G1_9LACO|nr:site-specific integrase [Secundilactobacillus angelensis]MCH5463310.1 site-specific integrase [Secundilactobacillus angelensis]NLR19206.1 site-specific integrase [Secundilactobacillus angelensis]